MFISDNRSSFKICIKTIFCFRRSRVSWFIIENEECKIFEIPGATVEWRNALLGDIAVGGDGCGCRDSVERKTVRNYLIVAVALMQRRSVT
jgi:hypothetical protein